MRLSSTLKCNQRGSSMLGRSSSASSPRAPFGDSRKAQMSASVSAAETYIVGSRHSTMPHFVGRARTSHEAQRETATRVSSSSRSSSQSLPTSVLMPRRFTSQHGPACSLRSARRGPPHAGCAGRGAPTTAPRARQRSGATNVGGDTSAAGAALIYVRSNPRRRAVAAP